jgi:hypothetical protein
VEWDRGGMRGRVVGRGGGGSNLHTKLTSSGPGINQAKISATRITDPQLGIPTRPISPGLRLGLIKILEIV